MLLFAWASDESSAGICDSTAPSFPSIFARNDFSLKCALPGVTVSMVCTISHSLFSSDMER